MCDTMNRIKIIKAETDGTLARCLRIRREVFTVEKGVSEEIETDGNDRLGADCAHFLLTYGGKDAGAVRLVRISESTVKVQRFCILKEFRRLSLGRSVMEHVENYCRGLGIRVMEIDSKYEVFPFYERCGCRRVSDVFIEAGVKHVKMIKEL